jgi:hypothetical protein
VSAGQTPGRLAFGVYDPEHAFAHASGDEFERLKAGDQVEAQLETVRTEVGASAP